MAILDALKDNETVTLPDWSGVLSWHVHLLLWWYPAYVSVKALLIRIALRNGVCRCHQVLEDPRVLG